jgi:phosphoglucomutase/phosphopentomutase
MEATAASFAQWDTNPTTRALHAQHATWDGAALSRAFGARLEFGTAGLRGPMGVGCARMNEVTVMQAAQGLVAHLLEAVPGAAARGVVVGYDHRAQGGLSSRRFALLTAAVCLARGVRCHLFEGLAATPLVPFAILHLGAAAGVMVTASHNPKEDNGYKVYWGNGAQIISPVDKAIAAAIAAHAAPWEPQAYAAALDGGAGEAALLAQPLHSNPMPAVLPAYLAAVTAALCRSAPRNALPAAPRPGITYTAMHGVGTRFAQAVFAHFQLPPFTLVQQQVEPNPDFPTVAVRGARTHFPLPLRCCFTLTPPSCHLTPWRLQFPNPEEGAGALKLAIETADAANDSLILANDPDADRLAVAEWVPAAGGAGEGAGAGAGAGGGWAPRVRGAPGAWRVFTGNEIGALLAAWRWRGYLEAAPGGAGGAAAAQPAYRRAAFFCASAVSSKFLQRMAQREGFSYEETLTGFKWMGNAMARAEGAGQVPLFAFEEAIGFACAGCVRDKDGLSAAALFAEMAGVLAGEGQSCVGALAALYARYGASCSNNGYLFVSDPSATEAIFSRLIAGGKYWARCGALAISGVRDLKAPGWDSGAVGGVPTLPLSSGSNMLTYTFANGVTATLRSSGTEPKLKWYAEGPSEEAVDATVECIMDEMLQPEAHGLKRPPRLVRERK